MRKELATLPVLLCLLAASACSGEAQDPNNPQIVVRTYASEPPGSVNTHWVETPDIVGNARTPFILEGRSEACLAQLDRLSREFSDVTTIYPGHGAAGGRDLIDEQARYLSWLRERVRQRMTDGRSIAPDERRAVIREIEARYPGYPGVAAINDLVGLNVDAVAEELNRATPVEQPR